MKKYIVQGGEITAHDGDIHYISAHRVAELYNVNPEECIFVDKNERLFTCSRRAGMNSLKILRPRSDGYYTL